MFPDKIKITDDLIKLIIDTRKEHNLTAYRLSEKIGKNKSWLPNIENKRTKNISREDLISLFKDFAKEKNMDAEEFVIKYLSPTAIIELDNNVTVPNHYLQTSMRIYSPDHEDLHISDEERLKRVSYYMEEKPYEIELMKLKKKLKDLSDLIVDEFSYCQTANARSEMLDMVDTIFTNLTGEFSYSQKLYQIALFHGDAEMAFGKKVGAEYLKDTSQNINNFYLTQKLAYAHANICSDINFEENRYNLFVNIMLVTEKTNTEELDNIMFDLDGFIYKLHEYILTAKEKSEVQNLSSSIDFIVIFKHIIKTLNDFIQNAQLNYSFEYTIPKSNTDLDELAKKCLELNNITYEIKQAIRNKQ